MKQPSLRQSQLTASLPAARSGRLLLPAALLAVSCFTVTGFLTVADSFGQDADTKKVAQDADAAKAGQKKAGRGRLSGRTAPPKPVAVPSSPKTVQRAPVQPVGFQKATPPVKPVQDPTMSAEEQKKANQAYLDKLKAAGQQNGSKYGAAPRPPRNPNAKLEIEYGTETHDFGRSRQGDQLTHTFKMKSSGSEPLIISQASPTCGCTLGEIKVKNPGDETNSLYRFGDPIQPNAEIEVEATLDTGSKRNDTQVRIQVYSNDGKAAVTSLVLKASVQPFIVATPAFLQLGQIRQGEEKTAKVNFRTQGGERVLLTRDESRMVSLPEGLSYEVEAINPDAEGKSNQWTASFKIDTSLGQEGAKGYLLRLNTDLKLPQNEKIAAANAAQAAKSGKKSLPLFYSCDANVSYNIIGALSMQPQYISLGLVRPGQPQVRSTRLTAHEEGFDLSGVKVEIVGEGGQELQWKDRFSAAVKPVPGASAVDIELRLDGLPEAADGAFRGRVKILTGHESKPEMFLRFSGVCRKLAGVAARPAQPQKKAPQKGAIGVGGDKK